MRNSEVDQAAWRAHVEDLRRKNAENPEPIIDGPKIRSPKPSPIDMAPNFSGDVVRKRNGKNRAVPVVLQTGFTETADPTNEFQANDSKGNLKRLTPIEEEARQSTEGYVDPLVARKAQRQRFAIKNNTAK